MILTAETGQGPRLESQDDIGYLTGQHSADEYERQVWTSEHPLPPLEGDSQEALIRGFVNR